MAKKAEPPRVAAALQYLQQMRDRAADFGGGVVDTLADRARSVGGLAYEALTSDPNMGRMTTAEYAQAADRPTPRLDQAAQDFGTIGKAIVTQPIQTGKALVQGEIERAQQAMTSPRAAGEYAGSMVDPMRIAAALRKTAPIAELDVYHGTPHRFDPTEENPLGEFDASKIGTGEGAQAYGHGIYLAENPNVAKGYKTANELTQTLVEGKVIDAADPRFQAAVRVSRDGYKNALNKTMEEAKSEFLTPEGRQSRILLAEQIKALKGKKVGSETTGAFYKADLPDEMIDRMLDWDKPLSEQPEAVRKALREVYNADWLGDESKQTGQDLYKRMGKMHGDDIAAVSRDLRDIGIPGIRYLDAGSRGKDGTGTRNFVVFPGEEKKVKILKRD